MGAVKLGREHYNEYFIKEIMEIVYRKLDEEGSRIYINQNQAFKRFGRVNVEKWVKALKIKAFYRDNTVQYRMQELLKAAENQQDYLIKV